MSDGRFKELAGDQPTPPEPDDFGTFDKANEIAKKAGDRIVAECSSLGRRERLKVSMEFRRKLIPPRRPGRPRTESITAAYADYQAGVRWR